MKKPVKERYNAKARRSSVGGSSHKNKRSLRQRQADTYDSNAQLIVPGSEEDLKRKQAEQQRRQLLESSGQDASAPMSSKKRKRLDAYIASRLKKEERVRIMQKLAHTSAEVDRTALKSAATLGTGRAKTMEERIDTAGQKTVRSGKRRRRTMNGAAMQIEEDDDDADLDDLDGKNAYDDQEDDDDDGNFTPPHHIEDDGQDHGPVGQVEEDPIRRARIIAAASLFDKSNQPAAATPTTSAPVPGSALAAAHGSALARDANGNPIMPAMRKRTKKPKVKRVNAATRLQQARESDSSFDSSDSDNESATASASGSRLAPALNMDRDLIGPAPRASLSRKNQEKRLAQALDVKGKGKAVASGTDWVQDESHDEQDTNQLDGHLQTEDEDDSDLDSEEPDTDEDEEAIFLEAMRRRGLLPTNEPSLDDSHASPTATTSAPFSTAAPSKAKRESTADAAGMVPQVLDQDQGRLSESEHEEQDGSEDDDDGQDESQDDDQDTEEEDEDEEEDTEEYRSRRRGIGTTKRSSGFKDWARAALGIGGSAPASAKRESTTDEAESKHAEEDDTAYNLEPVGGFKIKVGDLMPTDGVARGPLGRDEENVRERSAFAAKHYAELEAAVASDKVGQEPGSTAPAANPSSHKVVTHVEVQRSEQLTVARLRLPVVAEEDTIVRTIMENAVTVICGETGSGKTTQVPQFLYEAAFGSKGSLNPGMIGVTQPRRVAAVSMAQRVASELSLPADRVSHQIRYDATVSAETAIKFMTDGVLLRELATDFLLTKYSAIMVDEAHERSINTDVLIGVLSRVVRLREKRWLEGIEDSRPLRLIIMSATLRVSDFTENTTLFPSPPPVINIDARQHPVTVHFNRKTVQDYITESVKKATKIHARLPPGGILIFLTGQQEITTVCKKLEQRFGRKAIAKKNADRERVQGRFKYRRDNDADGDDEEDNSKAGQDASAKVDITARDGDVEAEEVDLGLDRDLAADVDDGAFADLDDPDALDTDDEAGGSDSDSEGEGRHDDHLPDELKDDSDVPMHILPLYSLLPSEKQMRIFEEPPVDTRLVVVATNVAETSLTIPNIRYVIDCGRSKERKYDLVSGVQSYEVSWISKASASQRAGRAGRTGPGHCYRLYSSAVYEDHFKQFSSPEILRTPVDGLVLSMKAMNIDNVANFPFPTPPDRLALKKAEQVLTHLGALQAPAVASVSIGKNKRKLNHAQVTKLGRTMTLFPVSPRYGKMIAQGQQHGCLPYVVAMVAALSVGDPFIREQLIEEEYGDRRAQAEGDEDHNEGDDYDRAFGKMEGDADLDAELKHVTNSELLDKERRKARRAKYFATMRKFEALGAGLSDTFRLLSVVGAYEYAGGSVAFCEKNFLRAKAMEEIHKLRAQLCSLISSTFPDLSTSLANPKLAPPTDTQLKVIRQLIASAYIDQVAVRADLISNQSVVSSSVVNPNERTTKMLYRLRTKGGGDRMQSTRGVPYKAMGVPGFAFIHPTSSFYHSTPPSWVVFSEVHRSNAKFAKVATEDQDAGTVWLKTLTKINPVWLATLGRALCTFSKPVPTAGAAGGELDRLKASVQAVKAGQTKAGETTRDVLVTPTYAVGSEQDGLAGGLGWQLPAIKAKQKFVDGRWVLLLP